MSDRSKLLRFLVPIVLLIGVAVWWGTTGVWVVQQDEQGVVTRFGKVDRVVQPGMQFTLPAPFERLERVRTTEVRIMPVGYKLRDDVLGIPPLAEEIQWLTGNTNIVEMKLMLQYVISDPARYLFRVADLPSGESPDFAIRKAAESVLTRLVGEMAIDDVLSIGKAKLQATARSEIQEQIELLQLGVTLVAVNILEANPPAEVRGAFNDVINAYADGERQKTQADGYRRKTLPGERARADQIEQEAQIYAKERIEAAKGVAARFAAMATEVKAAPRVSRLRLWLETVEAFLARGERIVYDDTAEQPFRLRVTK
ncbi:MAG: FtsH protease activity modulator HflK [Planctomycetota bacterium]